MRRVFAWLGQAAHWAGLTAPVWICMATFWQWRITYNTCTGRITVWRLYNIWYQNNTSGQCVDIKQCIWILCTCYNNNKTFGHTKWYIWTLCNLISYMDLISGIQYMRIWLNCTYWPDFSGDILSCFQGRHACRAGHIGWVGAGHWSCRGTWNKPMGEGRWSPITHWKQDKMAAVLQTIFSIAFPWMIFYILIKISWRLNKKPALV